MTIRALVMSVCLLAGPSVGSAQETEQQTPETSKALAYATYQERAGRVVLVVGSLISRVGAKEPLMPLQIAVGVDGPGAEVEITPGRFQLIDSKGNIYNAASVHEVSKESGVLQVAKSFDNLNPLQVGLRFTAQIERVFSNFYPMEGGKFYVVSNLPPDTYLVDLLFFPTPHESLGDVLTLQLLAPGMDQAVRLRFSVPLEAKKSRKNRK